MKFKFTNEPSYYKKMLLKTIMRTFIFLCCSIIFAFGPKDGYSQNANITIDADQTLKIKQVFRLIHKQTNFKFIYRHDLIKNTPKIYVKKGIIKANALLDKCLSPINFTFTFTKNNTVIVKKKPIITKNQNLEKISNEIIQLEITGTVTDASGQPLPGANILEKGTANGALTDFDGNFSISVSDSNAILVVSYVGFATKEIATKGQTTLNVTLEESTAGLDEVVIIGYGSVKKSDLTGAVTSISSDDLTNSVSSNVTQQLTGKAAGVQIFQNSNEPGGGATIQIRGVGSINAANQPLYVIDGLPISNGNGLTNENGDNRNRVNPLNSINPGDIESIQILKDASSTAIYGSRGSNGVILITTKSGKLGKLKVGYQTRFSMSETYNRPKLLSPLQYQTVLNELLDAGASNASESERVTGIVDGGTDWQDEIYQSAPVQEHTLSFSGGDENKRFFSSLNYFDQEGLVKGQELERIAIRLNLTATPNDKFNYGMNLSTSYVDNATVASEPDPNDDSGVVGSANDYDPTASKYEDEELGTYFDSPFLNKENPLAILDGIKTNEITWRTIASVYGEYFFTPSLSGKLNLGTDYQNARKDQFFNDLTNAGRAAGGIGRIFTGTNYNYLLEATLTYNKQFNDKHALNVVGGVTTQKFFINYSNSKAQDFLSLSTGTNSLQSGDPLLNRVSSGEVESTLLSYLGRANYIFNDTYLLTATLRVDGSSKFGENNKFAYFPSMALAWKLHNEDFLSDVDIFDELKLRASYGKTGNQEIGNFNSLTTIRSGGVVVLPGGVQTTTATPSRIANPDLKWETSTQTDIGIDWAILGRRIFGSIDYYHRLTSDLLFNIPIPSQTGFQSLLSNIGKVKNQGLEFFVQSYNLTGDFKWKTSFNLSTVKNEVLDIGDVDQIITGGSGFTANLAILKPGEVMNSYYGWEVLGVWQTDDDFSNAPAGVVAGDWKYVDLNEDGAITPDDRKIIGNSIPDVTWGLSNGFEYKGITLNIELFGVHGQQLFNNNTRFNFYPVNFRRNKLAEIYLNRWTPENPTNEYASFINPFSQGENAVNSRTVEDASFVRLQNIALGYKFPLKSNRLFSSLGVEVSATNLHTWTNYSGPDPGVNINGEASAGFRYDYQGVPLSRSFSLSLRAEF